MGGARIALLGLAGRWKADWCIAAVVQGGSCGQCGLRQLSKVAVVVLAAASQWGTVAHHATLPWPACASKATMQPLVYA